MSCQKKQALKEKDMKERTLNVKDRTIIQKKNEQKKICKKHICNLCLWKIRKGLRIIKNDSIITNVDEIKGFVQEVNSNKEKQNTHISSSTK